MKAQWFAEPEGTVFVSLLHDLDLSEFKHAAQPVSASLSSFAKIYLSGIYPRDLKVRYAAITRLVTQRDYFSSGSIPIAL